MAQWHGFPVPWAASQSRKAGSIITYAALITACGKCEEWRQVPSLWLVSSSKKTIFWKKVVDVISQKWECSEWTNQNGYLTKFLATSQQPLALVWEFLSEPSVWCEHIFSEPLTSTPASTLMDLHGSPRGSADLYQVKSSTLTWIIGDSNPASMAS